MTKHLYLIRHALAESQGAGLKDFDRSLLTSGYSEASRIGKKLSDKGIAVDKVISSNATRAAMTTELICSQIKFPLSNVIFEQDIYEASVRSLLSLINNTEENINTLMIVGHNPVISYFSEYLVSEQIGALPTAGVVAIELEVNSWKEVTASTGKIEFLEYPES
ncbi:MAG TPA: histidine phosphatase family protein [Cytophagales bacterium]|nr:histidine phosphatase family protein [Cytophagales bacterium]